MANRPGEQARRTKQVILEDVWVKLSCIIELRLGSRIWHSSISISDVLLPYHPLWIAHDNCPSGKPAQGQL